MQRVTMTIVFLLLSMVCSRTAHANVEEMFSGLYKKIDSYLSIKENYNKAKDDAWYPQPFTTTKGSLTKDLNKLLDGTLEYLLDDKVVKVKHTINELKKSNAQLQERVADLKIQRQAPPEKKAYEIWKDSADDIDKKIIKYENEIQNNLNAIEENKQKIQSLLKSEGIDLSRDVLEGLLETVTGDDTLKSIVALKNVHQVLDKLQGILKEKNENIIIAKKYYGIFLLATQSYLHQLETFVGKIDTYYLPKLKDIRKENAALIARTQALANSDPAYANNLNAQRLNEKTAQKYEQLLLQQKNRLAERMKVTNRILSLALNTYETVSLAYNLSEMLKDGISGYEGLMSLPLIEPVYFENREMAEKFSELTKKLE